MSLLKTIRRLRDGTLSPTELASRATANHDAHGSGLHAYKTWDADMARRDATTAERLFEAAIDLGPLQGIPVSVKDLFGVTGLPTFAGTARRLPEKWEQQGPLVKRVRRQLGVITGKTHTVEMAFGGLGVNDHWETPRNPWDRAEHRVPGGSSSGAGVSLAEGSALLALGTDTAGSVRIPAAMTGAVGLKTTKGRWSVDGIVPLSPTLDTPGILARSAEDIAVAFAALDPSDVSVNRVLAEARALSVSTLRLGVISTTVWDDCQEDIAETVRTALRELEKAGATLMDVELPETHDTTLLLGTGSVVSAECDEFVESELPEWRNTLGPVLKLRIDDGATLSARTLLERLRQLRDLSRRAAQRFQGVDLLVCPTIPISPPRLSEVQKLADYRKRNMLALRNTCIANYMGLCAVSIPVGLDGFGMPTALQCLAPANAERYLVAAAQTIERILGAPAERLGSPLGSA